MHDLDADAEAVACLTQDGGVMQSSSRSSACQQARLLDETCNEPGRLGKED